MIDVSGAAAPKGAGRKAIGTTRLSPKVREACAFLGRLLHDVSDAGDCCAQHGVRASAEDAGQLAHAALQREALEIADVSDDGYALVTDDESARYWRDRCRDHRVATITLRPVRGAAELRAEVATASKMFSEAGLAAIEWALGPRCYADPLLAVGRVPLISARAAAASVVRIVNAPEMTWSTRKAAA